MRRTLTICIANLLLLLLPACEQDPFRIHNFGDAQVWFDLRTQDFSLHGEQIFLGDSEPDWLYRPDISYDTCIAIIEVCNNVDDNCNSEIDEGLNKLDDPRYCENCKGCSWLLTKNAFAGCESGTCTISSCKGGWVDANGEVADGCEIECTPSGLEICDGVDNDCNGTVDDGVSLPQNICKNLGPCQGVVAQCKGKNGWQCQYPATVELQPCTEDAQCGGQPCDTSRAVCPNIVMLDETLCDGFDGDCDGLADDPWAMSSLPNALGKECDVSISCTKDGDCSTDGSSTCVNNICTTKKGICRAYGTWACDGTTKTSVTCELVSLGEPKTTETCNGLDDDCDGLVDEAADDAAGPRVMDEMVHINHGSNNFYIYKYEATRPDATGSDAGELAARACSKPGDLPWASVSYAEAAAACSAAGKRLCTGAEWEAACQGTSGLLYPYGDTFAKQSCNGYENNVGKPVPVGSMGPCEGGETGLFDMSGNVREWTSEQRGTTPDSIPIYVVRGGAYHTPQVGLTCTFTLSQAVAGVVLPAIGFRCCSDSPP